MWNDLASIDPRFVYQGERTRYIAFPLGGVGSGGFSVSGSGRLVDWSIRNRPALQKPFQAEQLRTALAGLLPPA